MKLLLGLLCLATLLFGPASAAIAQPTELWHYKGPCYNSWCEAGWYSSPAVGTINGQTIIVAGFNSLWAVYPNGSDAWSFAGSSWYSGSSSRIWPGIVIADINNDGTDEVVAAHAGSLVGVFDLADGTPWSGFPRQPYADGSHQFEFRALCVADLNQNGDLEIIVGTTKTGSQRSAPNTYVLDNDGNTLSGWPQGANTAGIYDNVMGVADMDNDPSTLELIVPVDLTNANVYHPNGQQMTVAEGVFNDGEHTDWNQVDFYIDVYYEYLGYGDCSNGQDPIRTNYANGPVSIGDIDGNGVNEYVFVGRSYKFCSRPSEETHYNGLYVVNADRTRWVTGAYNWTRGPAGAPEGTDDLGDPLSFDYNNDIQSPTTAVSLGDIDGDGVMEMVFPSYDGKIHVFWADTRTEKHSWPFDLQTYGTGGSYVYASEVAIVDLDDNNQAEIIFTTWHQYGNQLWGELVILDYQGNELFTTPIPMTKSCNFYGATSSECIDNGQWGGGLAAPTIANIDDNADMEAVIITWGSGIVAYTIPGSADARIIWGTSRGNFHRTGTASAPPTGTTNGNPHQSGGPKMSNWMEWSAGEA